MASRGKGEKLPVRHGETYTGEEIEFLKKYYPILPTDIIARKLGRRTKAVAEKARKLGLTKRGKYPKYLRMLFL